MNSAPAQDPMESQQAIEGERDAHQIPKQSSMSDVAASGNTELPQCTGDKGLNEPNTVTGCAGYERVQYDPRLEQVFLNLQRRIDVVSNVVPALTLFKIRALLILLEVFWPLNKCKTATPLTMLMWRTQARSHQVGV